MNPLLVPPPLFLSGTRISNTSFPSLSLSLSLSLILVVAPSSCHSRARSVPSGTSMDVVSLGIHLWFMRETTKVPKSPTKVLLLPSASISQFSDLCSFYSICFQTFALFFLLFSDYTVDVMFFLMYAFSVDQCCILLCAGSPI